MLHLKQKQPTRKIFYERNRLKQCFYCLKATILIGNYTKKSNFSLATLFSCLFSLLKKFVIVYGNGLNFVLIALA